MKTLVQAIETNVQVDELGCWLWARRVDRCGYGLLKYRDRTANAHIFAYEAWYGPVPEGLELDHLCRVRHCVNPGHLEPVTHVENMRRAVVVRDTCGNGHPRTEENVRIRANGTRRCLPCHRAFNAAARARRKMPA